jgi:hypothetical protein
MVSDAREPIINRLAQDLIGFDSEDEVLHDRPVDRYLTGILYPQRTEIDPNDMDDGASEALGDDADEQSGNDQIPNANLRKPASMGLSFRLRPIGRAREGITIPVEVSGGRYVREREPLPARAGGEEDAGDSDGKRRRSRPVWRRTQARGGFTVAVSAAGAVSVRRGECQSLDGFDVHAVAVPGGDEWVVTVAVVNSNDLSDESVKGSQDELALFQAARLVRRPECWEFGARPLTTQFNDEDSRIAALVYRDVREFAVGHTCSATWDDSNENGVRWLRTTWLPTVDVPLVTADGDRRLSVAIQKAAPEGLLASTLADAGAGELERVLKSIPDGYAAWIAEQDGRIEDLPPDLQQQAREHLEACRNAERRIRSGIAVVVGNDACLAAFRLMNRAMALQRSWTDPDRKALKWRPFQLAFILQNLESLADRHSPDREVMDLLWFPTGGGKTEAYLGLIAFVLFLRRLRARSVSDGAGVACFMRYTLRLLTLQQFERASALTLACEYIRSGAPAPGLPDLRKAATISIGLWVGSGATPNKVSEAIEALKNTNAASSPRQLAVCPCCKQQLKWGPSQDESRILVRCASETCDLAKRLSEFAVLTVDETIYANPPSLLIGTIDKFAQLVRNGATRSLFRFHSAPPPDLIIQDELHLISGPLGSLAGLYEAAIDQLTVYEGRPAKVIGSTATIRRAADQVLALFNRKVAQFPPPGLDASNSCFAVVPENPQVRRYVGLTTAGRSAKFTLQAAYASLLQTAYVLPASGRDGYHTLVGYFNALRELGGALPLVQDDALASIGLIADRRAEEARKPREVVELTSRVSQTDIRSILSQLQQAFDHEEAVDILLATNMISVGVDVSRLGMMVVMGQPKTASEYIQATSRVGRDVRMPGLVLTILNSNKTRDRSHFETFTSWHRALYRGVEATSVTPFASRARDKALHAALVLMARHLIPGLEDSPRLMHTQEEQLSEIVESLLARIAAVDEPEEDSARSELEEIIDLWRNRSTVVKTYWNDQALKTSLLIAAEKAASRHLASRSTSHAWATLNAMRNVEPATQVKLVEALADES